MTNHYHTLGIPNFSDTSTARKAYLKLMKKYHPDVNPSSEAQAKSQAANAAYDALETPEKKSRYDRRLKWHLTPKKRRTYTPSQQTNTRYRQAKRYYTQPLSKAERIKRNLSRRQAQVLNDYEKGLKSFPITARYILCSIGGFLGWLVLAFSIANLAFPADVIFGVVASVFWFSAVAFYVNEYYKYHDWRARTVKPLSFDLDKRTSKMMYQIYGAGFLLALIIKHV